MLKNETDPRRSAANGFRWHPPHVRPQHAPGAERPPDADRRRQRLPHAPGVPRRRDGWDAPVPAGNSALLATAPVTKNPDGSTIVGPALEEFTNDNSTTT